jgi:hypothetical protein
MCWAMIFLQLAAVSRPAGALVDYDVAGPGLKDLYTQHRAGQVDFGSFDGQLL